MKIKTYDGRPLKGIWFASLKIDGIRCERTEDGWVSKSGKKTLFGLPVDDRTQPGEMYEYFRKDWNTSSAIRRHDHICDFNDLYQIWPVVTDSLRCGCFIDLTNDDVMVLLDRAVNDCRVEGLMLRQDDLIYRVKPVETHDTVVTDVYEGTGKHAGRLGGLVTPMGKVGGGFTDEEREQIWKDPASIIGKTIEVKCMELTSNGKFRHGSKIRIRWDK
jgi:hypothetical protein